MLQKRAAINWSLLLSLAINLISARAAKRLHVLTGILFSGLTVLHIWEHKQSFTPYFRQKGGEYSNMLFQDFLPTLAGAKLQAHFFMRHVTVLHYLPGRIRFFSRDVQHQPRLAKEALQKLREIPELDDCQINVETGSILIKYRPSALAKNPLLVEIEELAKHQAGGTRQ